MATLYHYLHCPYCIRVRMALGFLQIPYQSKSLAYDDEKTPISLIGKKMLPIWESNGKVLPESLDIILELDTENRLDTHSFLQSSERQKEKTDLEARIQAIGTEVHNLAMPVWIYTKEFNESSRQYFQKKKEEKRGPFKNLVKNKEEYLKNIEPLLQQIEKDLIPFYQSSTLTIKDIMIAAHIWGLYLVPEFQFSEALHQYLQKIKKLCHFQYMDELWS